MNISKKLVNKFNEQFTIGKNEYEAAGYLNRCACRHLGAAIAIGEILCDEYEESGYLETAETYYKMAVRETHKQGRV